jgi:hypothetical protein
MLAAAVQGIIQAAQTQWLLHGGDLASTMSQGLEVLERGVGTDASAWFSSAATKTARSTPIA